MTKKAIDLVTPYRFDLVLKYLYAKSIVKGYKTEFFKEMYKEHLRLWNGFREYDNPNKCTFEAFDDEFKSIFFFFAFCIADESKFILPSILLIFFASFIARFATTGRVFAFFA